MSNTGVAHFLFDFEVLRLWPDELYYLGLLPIPWFINVQTYIHRPVVAFRWNDLGAILEPKQVTKGDVV